MKGLTQYLQNLVIILGIFLLSKWAGVQYPGWSFLIIALGFGVYGTIEYFRGHKCGMSHPHHVVELSRKEAEEFIARHSENKNVKVDKRESD